MKVASVCLALVTAFPLAAVRAAEPPRFRSIAIEGLEARPGFWRVRPDEVADLCAKATRCSRKEIIATTPLGHPVYALFYGDFDEPAPQTNWSAGQGSTTYRNYTGRPAGAQQTFLLVAGIHGAEAECVAGAVNLIRMLETGRDFRGKADPDLLALVGRYRFIVVPCLNMDGRAISPDHLRGVGWTTFRAASQGTWRDGTLIGWRGSKSWFPLPLDRVAYPGGYPNADGYNIMHDATPGDVRTAEAKGLLKLAARWRVDALLNGHSYEFSPSVILPTSIEDKDRLERLLAIRHRINRAIHAAGLLKSEPATPTSDGQPKPSVNLNNLTALASGALALTLECSVSYDRPDKPPLKPSRLFSFDELMEPLFIALKEYLRDGLEKPFLTRGSETVFPD